MATGVISQANLTELIQKHFDLRPEAIIKEFNLRNLPKIMGGKFFRKTASMDILAEEILSSWENVEEKAAELEEVSKIFYKIFFMPDNFYGGLDFEPVEQEYL